MFYLHAKVLEKRNPTHEGKQRLYLDCLMYDRGRPEVISVRVPEFLASQWATFEAGESYQMPVSLFPRDNKVYVSLSDDTAQSQHTT